LAGNAWASFRHCHFFNWNFLERADPKAPQGVVIVAVASYGHGIEVILIVAASLALSSGLAHGVGIFVIFLSLALGLQNGAFRRVGGISVHTTYLTGMITSLISTEAKQYVPKRFLTMLYELMEDYLVTARELLSTSKDGDELKARLIAEFPGFTGTAMLDHQNRFLFPPAKHKG
jgi:hypothetical protein